MTTNTIIAVLLGIGGIGDIVLARALAGKLPPAARTALTFGGILFLVAAAVFALRLVQI